MAEILISQEQEQSINFRFTTSLYIFKFVYSASPADIFFYQFCVKHKGDGNMLTIPSSLLSQHLERDILLKSQEIPKTT